MCVSIVLLFFSGFSAYSSLFRSPAGLWKKMRRRRVTQYWKGEPPNPVLTLVPSSSTRPLQRADIHSSAWAAAVCGLLKLSRGQLERSYSLSGTMPPQVRRRFLPELSFLPPQDRTCQEVVEAASVWLWGSEFDILCLCVCLVYVSLSVSFTSSSINAGW